MIYHKKGRHLTLNKKVIYSVFIVSPVSAVSQNNSYAKEHILEWLFSSSLPSSLPFTSLTISMNLQDYIPAFLQRGEKVHFCTVHRHNVLRKRANHW